MESRRVELHPSFKEPSVFKAVLGPAEITLHYHIADQA